MSISLACAQIEVVPGRPDLNFNKMTTVIKMAVDNRIDIIFFPELAISGYLLGDLWEQSDYLSDCQYYGEQIIRLTEQLPICVVFGNIALDYEHVNEDGHIRKYNAAFVAYKGKLVANQAINKDYYIKTSLPNYREFDDARHFYSMQKLAADNALDLKDCIVPARITIREQVINLGIMLCEDGWSQNYTNDIPKILAANAADILCNISCSPFTKGKADKRIKVFSKQAKECARPLVYCNNIGVQNNGKNIFSYDGSSGIFDYRGQQLACAPLFEEYVLALDYFAQTDLQTQNGMHYLPLSSVEETYTAIHYATKRFLELSGIKKMVVGLSGGIDSAVTAALFVDILGPQNVLLINMPGEYNSDTTQMLAKQTAEALCTNYLVVPIAESCEHTRQQLTQAPVYNFADKSQTNLCLTPFMMENVQARDRGARVLAAAAAAFGGAFSCNSNKTELTVGYATFYGDICGAVAPIADIYKQEVYALGRYLNQAVFKCEVIPELIFAIKPSAELSSAQTVGTGGDPLIYEYHDALFKLFVESWVKYSPAGILELYSSGKLGTKLGCGDAVINQAFPSAASFIDDLEKWWKMFAGFAVAKRIQAPPIISISRRAFGYDYRESQLTPYFSNEYYRLKEQILNK